MSRAYISKGSVSVSGLGELRQAMKELADPKEVKKALRDANYEVSQKVLLRAQAIAAATGDKARVAAAGTLKAKKTEANASINLGSDDVPQALGEEFGSVHDIVRKNGRKGWNQFPQFMGKGTGYFLMPAIAEVAEGPVGKVYLDALEAIVDKTFK